MHRPILFALVAAACPSGEEPPPPAEEPVATEAPAADPEAPAAEPLAAAPEPQAGPAPLGPGEVPAFSRYIAPGAPTVQLRVSIKGGTSGSVEIFAFLESDGKKTVEGLHSQPYTGTGELAITAPATFDRPVYAMVIDGTEGPEKATFGGAPEPVTLAGADVAVEVVVGERPPWLEETVGQGDPGGTPPTPGASAPEEASPPAPWP